MARVERDSVITLHQNAQRLIRKLFVVNPFAAALRFPDHQTRLRRDHTKYLGLIEAVALLHQYQRPVKELEHRGQRLRYIEVTREDIAIANRLAHEVLGRSLDELPPQTRRLLGLVDAMVTAECGRLRVDRADFRFSRRQVRETTGWGDTQLKVHLGRLVELEYVVAHRGSGHSQRFGYELVYQRSGGDGPFLSGLIGADELGAQEYDDNRSGLEGNRSGQSEERSGSGRAVVGGEAGGGRRVEVGVKQHQNGSMRARGSTAHSNAHRGNGKSEHAVALASAAAATSAATAS